MRDLLVHLEDGKLPTVDPHETFRLNAAELLSELTSSHFKQFQATSRDFKRIQKIPSDFKRFQMAVA